MKVQFLEVEFEQYSLNILGNSRPECGLTGFVKTLKVNIDNEEYLYEKDKLQGGSIPISNHSISKYDIGGILELSENDYLIEILKNFPNK